MQRELWRIPFLDFPLYGFGLMVLLGVLFGLWLLHRESKRQGLQPDVAVDTAIWTIFAGLIGARIFYCVQFWDEFKHDPWLGPFKIWQGGIVIYGAMLAGTIFLLFNLRLRRLPVLTFTDSMAPALALGMGFGRIGCFLNGCCWGKPCTPDFSLGVVFPPGSPIDHAMPDLSHLAVHPTQLYESTLSFLLAWILWRANSSYPARGVTTGLAALLYGLARFSLEDLRGDHHPLPGSWPVSQTISLFLVCLGTLVLGISWRARSRSAIEGIAADNA